MSDGERERVNEERRISYENRNENEKMVERENDQIRKSKYRGERSCAKWKAECSVDRERKKKEKQLEEEKGPHKEYSDDVQFRKYIKRMEENYEREKEERKKKKKIETCERIRSADRERMQEKRSKQTDEEKKADTEEAKKRMILYRSKRNDEQRGEECDLERERKTEERNERSVEKWQEDCRLDTKRKKDKGGAKEEIEKDFERINQKHKKRQSRSQRDGKAKLQQKLKAKKGMKLFRNEGRLRDYMEKNGNNSSEMEDWQNFMKNSKRHVEMAENLKPDIVQKLNEKIREEKEKKIIQNKQTEEEEERRKKKVEEDGGEWVFNSEYSEYYWVGEGEPIVEHDTEVYKPLTKEQLDEIKKKEEEWLEELIRERKEVARDKRQAKNAKLRAAMKQPINPFPETELCAYEKIRIDIIKEREDAMIESGFFDDLKECKKKIGLLK